MPTKKKKRTAKKRKSKLIVRECCICAEDCTVNDFPTVPETVALSESVIEGLWSGEEKQHMCHRKGSCTDICVGCLLKLKWAPHSGCIVSDCPLCKQVIAFSKSMIDRVLTSSPDKYAAPIAKIMTKQSFNLGQYNQIKLLDYTRQKYKLILEGNRMTALLEAKEYRLKQTSEMMWETKTLHTLQSIRLLMMENGDKRDIPRSVLYSHAKLITEIKARPFNDTRSSVLLMSYLNRYDPDSNYPYEHNMLENPETVMDNYEPLYRAPSNGDWGFNDGDSSEGWHGTFANREEALLVLMINHGMARHNDDEEMPHTASRTLHTASVRTQTPFSTHFGFEMRNDVRWVENSEQTMENSEPSVEERHTFSIIHPRSRADGFRQASEFPDEQHNFLIRDELWNAFYLEGQIESLELELSMLQQSMSI